MVFIKDENDSENADGVRGHLEAVGEINHVANFYSVVKGGTGEMKNHCFEMKDKGSALLPAVCIKKSGIQI